MVWQRISDFLYFLQTKKEKSQDGWVKQLHQSECPNIFLHNALNSSFRTFRRQHVVNDIRIAIQATFWCFHLVFSIGTIRVCILKISIFHLRKWGKVRMIWGLLPTINHLAVLRTIIIFFNKAKKKTKLSGSLFLKKDVTSFKLCLA